MRVLWREAVNLEEQRWRHHVLRRRRTASHPRRGRMPPYGEDRDKRRSRYCKTEIISHRAYMPMLSWGHYGCLGLGSNIYEKLNGKDLLDIHGSGGAVSGAQNWLEWIVRTAAVWNCTRLDQSMTVEMHTWQQHTKAWGEETSSGSGWSFSLLFFIGAWDLPLGLSAAYFDWCEQA